MRPARLFRITAGLVVAVPLLGWLAYAGVVWLGYGRLQVDRRPDKMLDRYMPQYEVGERHEIIVNAPASDTWAAACAIDLQRSPVIGAIFSARERLLGAAHPEASPAPFLHQAIAMGWGILEERAGRELVMGSITQPWEANVVFHALAPDRFASFAEPGYVKIVWTVEAEPTGASTSIARTVTRVQTTDAASREKFRRYWAIFSPGILLIRYEALRLIRDDAERRFQRPPKLALPSSR
ncbi:MAG TPA: hypothetical protein VKT51_05100 [Candidatus Eremiobacteraceae bacterium]|nr:hypothetical protein [Candidatus Eremiobacteraceae bacterium]